MQHLDPSTIADPAARAVAERMIDSGTIDPTCPACQSYFGQAFAGNISPLDVFAPRHRASENCRSGRHPHCTCDTCF